MDVTRLLSSPNGLVVAPAGCGKTQLIVETLKTSAVKPYLVLTHTTAGIAALQARLIKHNVPKGNYRLATIAGWAISVILKFPTISGVNRSHLGQPNYPAFHNAAAQLFANGHINDILVASYSRVLIDEYQDCSASQHRLVSALSTILPTNVFGDPMQSIFGFDKRDPLPCWSTDVILQFPVIGKLSTPWRWNNANRPELGSWILGARTALEAGLALDISAGGPNITWIPLTGNPRNDLDTQIKYQYQLRGAIPDTETILIIGNSKVVSKRHEFARNTNGIGVVEPVDMKDITAFFTWVGKYKPEMVLDKALSVATDIMTGVGKANLVKRSATIKAGKNRTPGTEIELSAVSVLIDPSSKNLLALFTKLEAVSETKVYRHSALTLIKDSLQISMSSSATPIEAVINVLEKRRYSGEKRIPNRAIGSTLLLKGLEADHVIILDSNCDTMDAKNLYVALSRGAKSISVFSRSPIIGR